MHRFMLLSCCLLSFYSTMAKTIVVKNKEELKVANLNAKPGDSILLQNGEWKNSILRLSCSGTKDKPIVFKAQTAGKVLITGASRLEIGGTYLIIDGFYFTNGYAGLDPVITFRINNNQLANNCRVTNTVINDFNNPKRMDENYWITFYGKNNRLDHCSFLNKKNMGVLLAVILDDERSRENHHSIDHNYFGLRLPLASNTGEIIRVGVSQHCEFNSNTEITDNFFENCDGETEIVSIKSGSNVIRNNLFKACQGAVVLRHGNFNTVENNVFIGDNKAGTGGVRIINKGQWVVNNLFYQCRGTGFRSPLSVMNGVPNSPAFRYLPVTDAVIANNSFVECTPLSFCEGSDSERSEPPKNVMVINNIIYNTIDSIVYNTYDNMDGIHFAGNPVSNNFRLPTEKGFYKTAFNIQKANAINLPLVPGNANTSISDSLSKIKRDGFTGKLSSKPGYASREKLLQMMSNARKTTGVIWLNSFAKKEIKKTITADCNSVVSLIELLEKNISNNLTINLTAPNYTFTEPIHINGNVTLTSSQKSLIQFSTPTTELPFLIEVKAGYRLTINKLNLDFKNTHTLQFINTDTSGSSQHSKLFISQCIFSNLNGNFFNAAKSGVTDSIFVTNSTFSFSKGILFRFMEETGKKGYYNVEQLSISNCIFNDNSGPILSMLRGGNDESTMGPTLHFTGNRIKNSNPQNKEALIYLYGTQVSTFLNNRFINAHPNNTLMEFVDAVRAIHLIKNNSGSGSGKILANKYVISIGNKIN